MSSTFQISGVALAGTEAHGLYRTLDHGTTWHYVEEFPDNRPVNAVTLDAGAFMAISGNQMWRSIDGGDEWMRIRLSGARRASLLALACAGDGVVLAGVNGTGVIRSEDGGSTWASSSDGLTSLPLLDLKPSPDMARDGVILAGSATEGVLRSADGGREWTVVTEGLPAPTITSLVISPTFAQDGIALALSADTLVRSTDAGHTWEPVGSVPADLPVMAAALSPTFSDDGVIALGCYGGFVLMSGDAGGDVAGRRGAVPGIRGGRGGVFAAVRRERHDHRRNDRRGRCRRLPIHRSRRLMVALLSTGGRLPLGVAHGPRRRACRRRGVFLPGDRTSRASAERHGGRSLERAVSQQSRDGDPLRGRVARLRGGQHAVRGDEAPACSGPPTAAACGTRSLPSSMASPSSRWPSPVTPPAVRCCWSPPSTARCGESTIRRPFRRSGGAQRGGSDGAASGSSPARRRCRSRLPELRFLARAATVVEAVVPQEGPTYG